MAYYKNLIPVNDTGGTVYIHQLEGSTKGTFYVRVKRENAKGYFRKSLRTTDESQARIRALKYWLQVREAEEQNVVLAPRNNFRSLMKDWFKHREKTSPSLTARRAIIYQFQNYYEPYFGSYNVANITERSYIQYLNHHRLIKAKCPNMRKRPTIRTLAVEQQNLRSFLQWCFQEGKMRTRVDMRNVQKNEHWIQNPELVDWDKPQRREMVSMDTYDIFRRYLRYVPNMRSRDTYESSYHAVSRRRMHFYLLSIYNFTCRAGEELLNLQFKDFDIVQAEIDDSAYYMRMTTAHGKKVKKRRGSGPRQLVYYSDYAYLGYFKAWVEFLQENGYPTAPDSYVFPTTKRKTKSSYHKGYKSYIEWDGSYKPFDSQSAARQLRDLRPKVKAWAKKNKRLTARIAAEIDMFSPYSVRHVAIKQLITTSEYDFHRVAERCNTSVSMIENFYYMYGDKPEGRLVSKHPTPLSSNTRKFDDSEVSDLINLIQAKRK